jgi:protein-disulfide isomerase-like protein with CxxC motif
MIFSTPSELRYLFCSLTLQGFPTLHILENERFHLAMTADYHTQVNVIRSYDRRRNVTYNTSLQKIINR